MAININDPLVQSTLLRGGLDILGGSLSGMGQGKMNDAQLQAQNSRDQVDAMLRMLRERGVQEEFRQTNSRLGNQAAGTILESPLKQQADRQSMALRRALLFDGPNGGPQYALPGPDSTVRGFVGNLPRYDSAKPFFTDQAMANAEKPFWDTIGGLTGGQVGPDLTAAGYQGVGGVQDEINAANQGHLSLANADRENAANRTNQTEAAIQAALGGGPGGTTRAPEKKGRGFWKTLANIGLLAAPIVAAPFTGGTSLALIGAGAGAARGAMNGGGVKGTLMGAGMGAATSYLGGMGKGATSGFNNAMGAASRPLGNMAAPAGQLVYGGAQAGTDAMKQAMAARMAQGVRF